MRRYLLAAALAPWFLTACFETKSDDDDDDDGSGDDGSWDSGTSDSGWTGSTDGGTGDGGSDDYDDWPHTGDGTLVPVSILLGATVGVDGGELTTSTLAGDTIRPTVTVSLIDEDYFGDPSDAHHCTLHYDVTGAPAASDCTACWSDGAWRLDGAAFLGTTGACDALDSDRWGEFPDEATDFVLGFGFGPMSSDFANDVESYYADSWDELGDGLLSSWFLVDVGAPDWFELNTALAYDLDGDGSFIAPVPEGSAPDATLVSFPYYGFNL